MRRWCFLLLWLPLAAPAVEQVTLASPRGLVRLEVALGAGGQPVWRSWYAGQVVTAASPLGLVVGDHDLTRDLRWLGASAPRDGVERYRLWTGPQSEVESPYRACTVTLGAADGARLLVDLRVADGGLALRYRVPAPPGSAGGEVTIAEDATGFAFGPGRAWLLPYHRASDYTPAYEDYFQEVAIGQAPGPSRGPQPPRGWSFGGLYRLAADRVWALSVESDVTAATAGAHLSDGTDGVYRVRWPGADEYKKQVPAVAASSAAPVSRLPWTGAWRGLALAATPAALTTTTWPTDLAAPCAIADPSWIEPGHASWSWLSTPDRFDQGVFETFLDFGVEMGWRYSLLDAGWWNLPLDQLARQAAAKGVRLLLWGDSTEMYDVPDRRRRQDEAAQLGIAGFKIDFWGSDRQLTNRTTLEMLADAADRQLVIVLHGGTIPRGWQRTWPNLLSAEAVLGEESYMYEGDFAARAPAHHAVLPFTRNALAPMDYTPSQLGGSTWSPRATPAHQLALTVLQTSGVLHHGGHVDWYRALPAPVLDLLRGLPARWDESRCLVGEPGGLVVMARRAGSRWYLAAINGTDQPRTIALDQRQFARGGVRNSLAAGDGPDGGWRLQRGWPATLQLAPYGGALVRFER